MSLRTLTSISLFPVLTSFVGYPRDADRGPSRPSGAERVAVNDNRRTAGVMRDGVLTLTLDARIGAWHPDGDAAPGADVPAFGEPGRAAQIPAPLLRAPAGTKVVATVRNSLPNDTLTVHGLHSRGVAGTTGTPIAPRDSFEARFTPPRPGTFIYHSHVDESRQQAAGLTGAIVVLGPGQRFNPTRDLCVIITSPPDSATEQRAVMVNGAVDPEPLTLEVGVPHRLRMINITMSRPGLRVELYQDTTLTQWRLLARDGAELPDHRKVVGPAGSQLSIGQTMDVEVTPRAAGPHKLLVRTSTGILVATLHMNVTP